MLNFVLRLHSSWISDMNFEEGHIGQESDCCLMLIDLYYGEYL
jgi:hypothetical protein